MEDVARRWVGTDIARRPGGLGSGHLVRSGSAGGRRQCPPLVPARDVYGWPPDEATRTAETKTMLTGVDHVVVAGEVDEAIETYRRLGFDVMANQGAGGASFVPFGNFHIELRSGARTHHQLVLRTDGLNAEVERLNSAGFDVSETVDDPVTTAVGVLSRRTAVVDATVPVGLVEYESETDRSKGLRGKTVHPNSATVVERVYLAVASIDVALETFEQMLGMSAPEPEMGTVIMSMMSVFYLGDIGIAVAEPRGPGPTATALAANGPDLFQVLLRADHLDVAAAEMVERGAPEPARGTRLSGESALLVDPADACGLYVAFAGLP